MGRYHEAVACYRRSLELQPANPEFHANFALALLVTGDYERGWMEYECALAAPQGVLPAYPRRSGMVTRWPAARSSSIRNRGSATRCTSSAMRTRSSRPAAPSCSTAPALLTLARTCPGIDRLVPADAEPPPFDVHVPLLSLPRLFRTTVATIPAPVPYLAADPALVDFWRGELGAVPGLRVGIAWQGNPRYPKDRAMLDPAGPVRAARPRSGRQSVQPAGRPGPRAGRGAMGPLPAARPGRPVRPVKLCRCRGGTEESRPDGDRGHRAGSPGRRAWSGRCGCSCRSCRTGAGCWSGKTLPGTRRCGCSGSRGSGRGKRCSRAGAGTIENGDRRAWVVEHSAC